MTRKNKTKQKIRSSLYTSRATQLNLRQPIVKQHKPEQNQKEKFENENNTHAPNGMRKESTELDAVK